MINTLDLDNITKDELERIKTKILSKPCCLSLKVKPSNSKGYHAIIICKIEECIDCRLVFDDDKRFATDSKMPLIFQNFLFDEKIHFGKLHITKDNLEKIKEKCI
jgi:hypothetical protein